MAKSLAGQDLKVFNQASLAMSQHNWEQAEKLLSSLHDQFPKNDFVSNNLAVIYFNQGRLDEAQELLSDIIRSTESTRTAFENLQTLYGYSAAKAYSKGLNLLKPIELPSMIVRNYELKQQEVMPEVEKNIVPPLEPLLSEQTTTSNEMVAMLNSDSDISLPEQTESAELPAKEPLQEQTVVDIAPPVEAKNISETKKEKVVEPIAEKTVAIKQQTTAPIVPPTKVPFKEPTKESVKEILLGKLDNWAKAWSDGDINAYLDFYSPNYSPRGKSRKAWLKNRRSRVKPSKNIQIDISRQEVYVNKNKTQANILFEQKYRSKNYQDKVKKRITWLKRKGEWVIAKEVIIKTL